MAGEKKIELMIPADRDYINNHLGGGGEKNRLFSHHLEDSEGTAEGVAGNFRGSGVHEGIDMHSGLYYLMPVLSVYDGVVKETFIYGTLKQSAIIIEHDSINFIFNNNKAYYTTNDTYNKFFSSYVHMRFIISNEGDKVKKGEIIGFLGGIEGEPGAGHTDQMHLHFTLGIKNLPNTVEGLNYRGGFTKVNAVGNKKNVDDVEYMKATDNWHINPYLDTNKYIGNATDIFKWGPYQVNYDIDKKHVDTFLYKMLNTTNSTIVIDDKSFDSGGKVVKDKLIFYSFLEKLDYTSFLNIGYDISNFNKIDLSTSCPPNIQEIGKKDSVSLNIDNNKTIDNLVDVFITNVWGNETDKNCDINKRCTYKYSREDYRNLIKPYLKTYLTPTIEKKIYYLIKDTTVDWDFNKRTLKLFIPNERMNNYKDNGKNLFSNTLSYIECSKNFLNWESDDANTKYCIIKLLDIISGRHSSDNPFPSIYIKLFNTKSMNIRYYKNNKDFNFVLDFFIDILKKQLEKIQGEDVVPINLMRYAGYKINGNDNLNMIKDNIYQSTIIDSFLNTLENVFKQFNMLSGTSTKPKPFIGPPLPPKLNSETKIPNINLPAKAATATAAKTISSAIMGLFGMAKSGLGTGEGKAGGAGGIPSKSGSAATAKSTGKNPGITPLSKDKYNKMPEPDKPKTTNANPSPKQNNLLGGKNKPGANSWQDMIKGTFGSLTAGAGKGSVSGSKAATPQQDTGALAKANTASQPYPALNGMKNAGMPPKPYGAGFQAPTVPNSTMPAQKSGGFMGPPAPTSLPSFASTSYKPQLPNTNYIPESAPKGNTVKGKKKPDSQPGKPKVTEITIRGENADRYELMARELPSMWERYEKESAQRLI